jgi:transcriptional regulator with XRE-family HTH domain
MMCISLKFHEPNSINWGSPSIHYPARGQAPEIYASLVKYFRKDNGWSQELLAKASGLSLRTIQRAEKDGNSSAETQLALSAAFDISPKELSFVSSNPDVNWKRKNIMQSFLALLVACAAIGMLFILGGELRFFADQASAIYLALIMYSSTIIAFGFSGFLKSITGLSYIFANEISHSPATQFLAIIYKKQITFIYGGAFIGILVGMISIHANFEQIDTKLGFHTAYAVSLLIILYAAIFAEAILRPLATKLDHRDLATKFD